MLRVEFQEAELLAFQEVLLLVCYLAGTAARYSQQANQCWKTWWAEGAGIVGRSQGWRYHDGCQRRVDDS